VTTTLAYYGAELITVVKSFIIRVKCLIQNTKLVLDSGKSFITLEPGNDQVDDQESFASPMTSFAQPLLYLSSCFYFQENDKTSNNN
jgi:hypothetical protein